MKKKITSLVLSILMVFSILPISAFTAFAAELPDDWAGCTACSAENPHLISTTADLDKIRTHTAANKVLNGYFKLANDIVFTEEDFSEGGAYYNEGKGWLPLGHSGNNAKNNWYSGTNDYRFSGSLDGNGNTIKGIKLDQNIGYCGLFAYINEGASIKNITLDSFEIGDTWSGVLASVFRGTCEDVTILNCTVTPKSHANSKSGLFVSQLRGTVKNLTIKDSTLTATGGCWGDAFLSGEIYDANVDGVTVENCKVTPFAYTGVLSSSLGKAATVKNVTLTNCEWAPFHADGSHNYLFDSYSVADGATPSSISNITLNLKVSGQEAMRAVSVIGEVSASEYLSISNVKLNLVSGDNHELNAQLEENVVYVVEETTGNSVIKSNGQDIIANLNGGAFPTGTTFAQDALTTPVKENHFFEGWFTDSELTTALEGAPVAGSSYYAKWDELAEREFVVTTNKNSVIIGETVDVVVTLNGTELIGAEWTLDYDKTEFELVSCTLGEGVTGTDGWAVPNGLAFAPSQVLATYTLKAIVTEPDGVASAFTVVNCEAFDIRESIAEIVVTPVVTPTEDVTTVNPDYVIDADGEFIVGKKLVLVHTNSADISFSYAGATMYKMIDKYAMDGYAYTFAIVVDAETYDENNVAIVYAEVATKFVLTYDANDYDLNDSGDVNLRDVSIAYSVLNGNDYTYADYMNIVLNADINADGVVNGADTALFVNAYSNAN